MTNRDYVSRAIAIAEQERWPLLGLSTTRRSLNLLALRYNDETIKCLACFVCGQLRTTCVGYPPVNLTSSSSTPAPVRPEIEDWSEAALQEVERKYPGTLLNNCGFDLWKARYVDRFPKGREGYPWNGNEIVQEPLNTCKSNRERHVSRWAIVMTFEGQTGRLFGCTEDIRCQAGDDRHAKDYDNSPFCRSLCSKCEVPLCRDCSKKLKYHKAECAFRDGGTIPMSISNDHYWGHVSRYIVEDNVT